MMLIVMDPMRRMQEFSSTVAHGGMWTSWQRESHGRGGEKTACCKSLPTGHLDTLGWYNFIFLSHRLILCSLATSNWILYLFILYGFRCKQWLFLQNTVLFSKSMKVNLSHYHHAGTKERGYRPRDKTLTHYWPRIKMRWVVIVTHWLRFTPEKGPFVPIGQEAGWTSELIWTQRLKEKYFASACHRIRSSSL
jgi:hypothetical protein